MTVKCLMLDVDGVLVCGRPSDGQHWTTGLAVDLGVMPRDLANHFFKAEWNDVVIGRKPLLPTLRAAMANIAPLVSAEDLIAYWFEMDSHIIEPVLSDLRAARKDGLPVFLATNQDHARADYLMHNMGLRDEVDGIVYSAKAGHQKPDTGFYAFAETMTGYRPSDLLFVDDTLQNVQAAAARGWSAVHWNADKSLKAILQRGIG